MELSDQMAAAEPPFKRRLHGRTGLQCRARIKIGARQYAGYLHNISEGGAKLRTITPIRKPGQVVLTLPDLPPINCQLKWTDSYNAGVSFELPLPSHDLCGWLDERVAVEREMRPADISEIVELTS
ncbi:MAG TPA: PilZ domain-containing protein [Sphingomicrobium sp.]|nr:PilZ domain-containing protein [Sphingomicrobium sp.]